MAHAHSTSTQSEREMLTEKKLPRGKSTPHALLGFASSGVHSLSCFLLLFLDLTICARCCKMCEETQTSRWNETCYESMNRLGVCSSLGDEEHMDLVERVVAECRQEDTEYEWSYSYDESEWSLTTSRMLRFGALFAAFVGRSVRRMFPL